MTKPNNAVDAVRQLFAEGSAGPIDAFLDENIELRPPTYNKSWNGRPLVGRLLRFAAKSLSDFSYTDHLSCGELHVMRFEARIGEYPISGVDIFRTNTAGKIVQFEIFARPPKAVLALRDAMAAHVKNDAEVASMMNHNHERER